MTGYTRVWLDVEIAKDDLLDRLTLGKNPSSAPRTQSGAEARLRRERNRSAAIGAAAIPAAASLPKAEYRATKLIRRSGAWSKSPRILSRVTGKYALKGAIPAALLGANAVHAHKELKQLRAGGNPVRQHKLAVGRRQRNEEATRLAVSAGATGAATLAMFKPKLRGMAIPAGFAAASTVYGAKRTYDEQKKLEELRRA